MNRADRRLFVAVYIAAPGLLIVAGIIVPAVQWIAGN